MYVINKSMKIYFNYDDGTGEGGRKPDQTVLMNLLDNAFKASEPEGHIEVHGHLDEGY